MDTNLKKQIPLRGGLVLFLIGFIISFFLFGRGSFPWKRADNQQLGTAKKELNCEVTSFRREGFDFTKPLLYVETSCEAPEFLPLKNTLKASIAAFKAANDITTASVYVRDFEHGRWTGVNETAGYFPASLSKVPLMISFLRKAKNNPAFLAHQFVFTPPPPGVLPVQNYKSNSIVAGKKYSVRDLLHYMIVNSDNNATWLLKEKAEPGAYDKVFIDLGVAIPQPDQDSIVRISARDFSVFFRALYNSSYLDPEQSEFALSLLSQTEFKDGFVKGLPPGTKVAHKFGEWDNGVDFELHESGIFYWEGKGYLMTVMTRGKDRAKLPNVISNLAGTIQKFIAGP